jgi:hypothetical protein
VRNEIVRIGLASESHSQTFSLREAEKAARQQDSFLFV